MKLIQVPLTLKKLSSIFDNAGFELYLVGGAVRDIILKKKASDWDCATNAKPEQVMKLFKRVIPTGIEHGTVTVLFDNTQIEITTYRTESDYSDGRHPDKIEYTSCIEDDLSRRDFTMNAIAINLKDGKILDLFEGENDIKKKIIKTVGDPLERFNEDGLRPVRAIRFATQLGFEIEEKTLEAISKVYDKIQKVSIERFNTEFTKLLMSSYPSKGIKLLEKTGLLNIFIPELAECRNVIQADARGFHQFDVLDHLIYSLDGAFVKDCRLELRLAALFHDVGKPLVRKEEKRLLPTGEETTIYTFFNHEKKSKEIAQKVLLRLRFPNKVIEDVCHLIENHMFHYESSWTDSAIRRFIVRVKPEYINDLFDLRYADVYGMTNSTVQVGNNLWTQNLLEFKDRINKSIAEQNAFSIKDLSVNGSDLINIGIKEGKIIGSILKELFEVVTEDPKQNNKDTLLEIAKNLYESINK